MRQTLVGEAKPIDAEKPRPGKTGASGPASVPVRRAYPHRWGT